ncbi:hypothetical protein [Rhizosphaericola mali]|uniref:Uncharacterized protein n=1 Tax=Rhizosphaericola mali TaxID=2545455 RepID=A0A5P2G4W2_9BACT|nr:hypothetical protein [Rhizosphaericola mali]QES88862.1 hypothetical protein E0W69_009410 [Rhizosphaericola mali]
MALLNPCSVTGRGSNTGVECGKTLGVPAGIIMVPANAKWSLADMQDFAAYIQTKIHAAASQRWYPVFTDLKNFEVTQDSDTQENFADGTNKMIRLGGYTLTFSFLEGGECLAKSLLSFNKKGYRFIVVDVDSQFKVRKNGDGSYSGLRVTDLYAPSPNLNTLAASYMNRIIASISVDEYIEKAEIFLNDTDLTELNGLLEVELSSVAAPTATKLTISAKTECAGTDLYDEYADALAVVDAWKVTDSTGADVAITAVAKNDTLKAWELTGAFTGTIKVSLVAPSVLQATPISVDGFESETLSITL